MCGLQVPMNIGKFNVTNNNMRLCASCLRTKSLCNICDSSAHCSLAMDVLGVSGFLIGLTLSSKVGNAFVYKRNKSS